MPRCVFAVLQNRLQGRVWCSHNSRIYIPDATQSQCLTFRIQMCSYICVLLLFCCCCFCPFLSFRQIVKLGGILLDFGEWSFLTWIPAKDFCTFWWNVAWDVGGGDNFWAKIRFWVWSNEERSWLCGFSFSQFLVLHWWHKRHEESKCSVFKCHEAKEFQNKSCTG